MKTKPTDRSISPQISSSTSPIEMMMMGAANPDSRFVMFDSDRKADEAVAK